MKSNLTYRATGLFGSLRNFTPMGVINCFVISTRGNDKFIDRYVIVASLVPITLFTLEPYYGFVAIMWPLGIWRMIEIIVFLLNTLLFDDYRLALKFQKLKPLAGVRRPLILLGFNFIEIVFWFAYAFRLLIHQLQGVSYRAWIDAVSYSFVTFSAFGSHKVNIDCLVEDCGTITTLSLLESVIGLFIALAAFSSFVALIPQRKSSDAVERRIKRSNNSA